MIGDTLSHYTILEKLGEGGMGVVYKAHDLKLDRLVALKFLPQRFAPNEEDEARFLQEARAAATLNHPNVCTVYDIREDEGQQYIVMEFVDGVTLRKKIEEVRRTDHVGLPVNDALSYAIQICDALQEAHSRGIVHRDVKAENIMVNSRNQIKVMDFGLAKLKGSLKLTRSSSTVGTLAYMAPEQIQGGEVDARSDIFSCGVVLFEMLTGRTPFRGEHEAAMMYSILNEEPDSVLSARPEIPPDLVHVLNNALEKEPQDRYQSAGEMVRELRRAAKQSSKVSRKPLEQDWQPAAPSPESPQVHEAAPVPKSKRFPTWGKYAVGGGIVLVAAFVLWRILTPGYEISKDMVFRPLNIPFTTVWYPSISSDGNWIAFPATDDQGVTEIFYMNASGGEPKRLTNDSVFKYTACISPDGSQILYSRSRSRGFGPGPAGFDLWSVSTLGGEPKRIAQFGMDGTYSPDGGSIAYVSGYSRLSITLYVANTDGSNARLVLTDTLGGPGSRLSLSWSPDGSALAWVRNFMGAGRIYQEIIIRDLQSGRERQITHDARNIDEVCWVAGGLILFSSNRGGATNIWAVPASGGNPVQITRGPGPDIAVRASADGRRILYLQQAQFGSIQIADALGLHPRELTPADKAVHGPRFSPDGASIAYIAGESDPLDPGSTIFEMGRGGEDRRRIAHISSPVAYLIWSLDGTRIGYSYVDTAWHTAVIQARDPSQPVQMGQGALVQWMNGDSTLNIARNLTTSWRVPLDGTTPERLFRDSTIVWYSPYGNFALIGDVRNRMARLSLRNPDGTLQEVGDQLPLWWKWDRDGKSLFLFMTNGTCQVVSLPGGKVRPYSWKNSETAFPADVSPDDRSTLFIRNRTQSKLIVIDHFM